MGKRALIIHCGIMLLYVSAYLLDERAGRGSVEDAWVFNRLYPVAQRMSRFFRDLKFRVRGPRPPGQRIVIVDIDSAALEQIGRWPWRRDYTAYLLQKTFEAGARVVGLDMIFSEPQVSIPEELEQRLRAEERGDWVREFDFDRQLAALFAHYADRLVVGWGSESSCRPRYSAPERCPVAHSRALASLPEGFAKFAYGQAALPAGFDATRTPLVSAPTVLANIPLFQSALKHTGFVNAVRDGDGVVRGTSAVTMAAGVPHPSFALEIARLVTGENWELGFTADHRLAYLRSERTGRELPITPSAMLAVNYRGPEGSFPYVSALDILSDEDVLEDPVNRKLTGRSKRELLSGAIVLVGTSALANFDRIPTPYDTYIPGVEVHATVLDNILSGDSLIAYRSRAAFWILLLLMAVGGPAYAFALYRLEGYRLMALTLGIFSLAWLIDTRLFAELHWDLNTGFLYLQYATVLATALGGKYLQEEERRNFLRSAFSKYVAPAVVDSILRNPDELTLGGRRRELTVMFCDIRGFTSLSETMEPQLLSRFLNDYLSSMTEIIFMYRGTLDKYIGDAIMAFWGAPLEQDNHAQLATNAAVSMIATLEKNRERFASTYGIDVQMGIGLSTGVVTVGNLGSESSFNYTVIGDEVNLAARLEGATKTYGVPILASERTLRHIEGRSSVTPPHMNLGEVRVKGKTKSVAILQLLAAPEPETAIRNFDQGRSHYLQRQWREAITCFERARDRLRNPAPAEAYLLRCRQCQEREPGPDWDGAWVLDSK